MGAKKDKDRVRRAIVDVIERHKGPIGPKSLYAALDQSVLAGRSLKAVSEILYEMRRAGELVTTGATRFDTRYDLPSRASASTIERAAPPAPAPQLSRDDVSRALVALVEQHGPVSGKSLYTLLPHEITRAYTYRTVRYMLYDMRASGALVASATQGKTDTRYDLPEKVARRQRDAAQKADRKNGQSNQTLQKTAQITRAELERARQLLQKYRAYFPKGFQCLALQYSDTELAEVDGWIDLQKQEQKDLAAAAEQLRAEAREQPVEFVTVEQQPLTAPAQPEPEQPQNTPIELSGIAQHVAQAAALAVERAYGDYSRAQDLLVGTYKRKIQERDQQIEQQRAYIVELQQNNETLQLQVDDLPVLKDQIAQLEKDVETALATAQENQIDAERYRRMMRAAEIAV